MLKELIDNIVSNNSDILKLKWVKFIKAVYIFNKN